MLLLKLLSLLRHHCLHHRLCPATGTPDGWGRSKPAAWGWHPQGLTRRMWVFHSTNPTSLLLFSAGLAHQCSHKISVSLGSNLTFHCLPNSPDREVVWCNNLNKRIVQEDTGTDLHQENGSYNLTFTSVNEKHAGNYTCKMKASRCVSAKNKNCPCKSHKESGTYGTSGLCAVGGM